MKLPAWAPPLQHPKKEYKNVNRDDLAGRTVRDLRTGRVAKIGWAHYCRWYALNCPDLHERFVLSVRGEYNADIPDGKWELLD